MSASHDGCAAAQRATRERPEPLAELQEEFLWLCDASHLPTIWLGDPLGEPSRLVASTNSEYRDA